ncbi:hypothetical protein RhiJN_23785 [Ceratobasidium sp. AG-Ba]|nr:hypothetical protein RhiJN_23785 [Ceratobasidium sp. AG-Ba]
MTSLSTWNVTLDDSSPLFSYMPFGDGAAGDGWATYYSISGFRQEGGSTPLGDSSHVTWNNRSSFSLSFYGQPVPQRSQANCTYSAMFDDILYPQAFDPTTGLLASFLNTTTDHHNITIVPSANGPDSAFAFDRAVVVMEAPARYGFISLPVGVGVEFSGISGLGQTDVYNNRNSSILYQGSWSELDDKSIPSTASPAPYHETKVRGSNATLEFQGEAVMISGALNWGHWFPSPVYNASSWWIVGDAPLFFRAGLDPNKIHTVTLTNMGDDEETSTIDLNSFTIFGSIPNPSLNPSSIQTRGPQSKSTPVGVIVGAAIGGGIVLLCFINLLIFLYRRYRNQNRAVSSELVSPNYGYKGYSVEPYVSAGPRPRIGYVTRANKNMPKIQPSVVEIGQFSSQPSPVSPSESNPMGEASSSLMQGGAGGQGIALDYGLLAEHVVARLPQARLISNGDQVPPEYMPPGLGNRPEES